MARPTTNLGVRCLDSELVETIRNMQKIGFNIEDIKVTCRGLFEDGDIADLHNVKMVRISRGKYTIVAMVDGEPQRFSPIGMCKINGEPLPQR